MASPSLRVLPATGPLSHRYRVAHSIPGRVRLQLDPRDTAEGAELAARLVNHPHVRAATWRAASRSIVVEYDIDRRFVDVLASVPEDAAQLTPAEPPARPLVRQFAVPALALATGLFVPGLAARLLIGICGLPIARRALRSLLRRHLSIDVLDTTAVVLLLVGGDVLAAGVTVGLVEAGERIRRRASGRARHVLRSWMGVDPSGVRVLRGDIEPRVPLSEVAEGDQVVVYAGESVPVDGIVVDGEGSLDNRTWTGESMPVQVAPGAEVLAGSVFYDGRVVLRVVATGDRTRAGKLAIALEDAIAADTRVSDLVYRIADRFVLPVMAAGGLVFAITRDLNRVIAMLIVDFGSGFRVSVPTAVLTTMMSGVRQNVLFKSGRSIEELARVDTIVFDKTGTLTTGNPTVVAIRPEKGFSERELIAYAAAAEGHVPHPLARALRRLGEQRMQDLPSPEKVVYQTGGGVVAVIDGRDVLVGDARLMARHGVRIPSAAGTGSSLVLVAVDGRLAGRFHLRDRIKDSAATTIRQLRQAGIRRLVLATGDHHAAAGAVSRRLGLDEYHARMHPEQKIDLIRTLRREGHHPAIVGDGINDAGAMAEAAVAVAVPSGADLAQETADVVLLGEDLGALVTALRLSREAMGIVRQNIGVVAAPNTLALGAATAGALNPLTATVVNNGSTIVAAVNALRPLVSRPALRR